MVSFKPNLIDQRILNLSLFSIKKQQCDENVDKVTEKNTKMPKIKKEQKEHFKTI